MQTWRPTLFVHISMALHVVVIVCLLFRPGFWPWGLGVILIDHAVILLAGLWPRSRLIGGNIVRLPDAPTERGEIALTFDDGPDPDVTPKVLAILSQHGVKATFFLIGERAAAHPEICREIVAAGHSIENHGQLHLNYYSLLGPCGWRKEIGSAQKTLESITGQRPQFFRALAGLRNPFLDPVLQGLDMRLATWSRRGYDTCTGDADTVLRRLIQDLKAGDILLMHDGNAARTPDGTPVVLEVLPALLEELAARNLMPVTLTSACTLH
jgi:peptidoglycan/xylan/chitin deacetylase (PgdA/CDA1 family)